MRQEAWFRWMQRRSALPPPPVSPVWETIERAYRETGLPRPSQLEVAGKLGVSEPTLRRWVRALGIERWSDVHRRIVAR
jgi:DNA-binding MurR/RpiR family transcriptional regulator